MLVKEITAILLISGTLGIEQFQGDTQEISEKDFHRKQNKKYLEKSEYAAQQFEKDYHRWSDEKYVKHASDEHKDNPDYMKTNEIHDFDFVDKYNKYGRTFDPKLVDATIEKNEKGNGKMKTLLHDTNVNYIKNNQKISGDSELITQRAVKILRNKEDYQDNYQNRDETDMKRYKKSSYKNLRKINLDVIPVNDTVLMARYILHAVDWAVLGTLSGRAPTKGSPFVCVKATSDGVENGASGIPYFYMSPLDLCTQDLQKDNRVSVLATLSETEFCKTHNLDPQDPRCAKLTLTGRIKKVKPGSKEETFARKAMLSKHPAMATWPTDHYWYFTKLKIEQIILLNKFGGATYIKVKDYLDS